MKKQLLNYSLLTVFALFLSVFVYGQGATTSSISGTVTDNKGETVPGASVIATHMPTGTKYSTSTREDGRFNLPGLRVGGPYTVKISFIGYKDYVVNDVTLSLGQDYKVVAKISSNAVSLAEVVVQGQQDKIINNNRTGAQETVRRSQIERLPTVGRSLTDFTKISPTSNGNNFGGRNVNGNNLTVDGALFNNAFGLQSGLGAQAGVQPIALDAVEQVQVDIAPYDVTQGRAAGTAINTVVRSGTNEFKGSVYTYFRGADLVGLKAKANTVAKPKINYNIRGLSVGGPIVKDKLFFFLSAEQERIENPPNNVFTALRPGQTAGGNVSQASATDLDQLKNFLQTKYGYDAGAYDGYNLQTQSDKITFKLDWNINSKNTLSAKYFYLKSFANIPPSSSGAPNNNRQAGQFGLPFFSSFYTINNNFNIGIVELNTRFNSKFSNKLTLGYQALRDFRESPAGGSFPLVDILNSSGQTLTSFGYEPFSAFNKLNSDILQASDNFTIFSGRHEITLGAAGEMNKFLNGFAPNYFGIYRFPSLAAFYNSANNGVPTATVYSYRYSALADGSFPFAEPKVFTASLYAQDKFQINDNFKLTYGVRADMPIYSTTTDPNPNAAALTFRDGYKIDVTRFPKSRIQLSPRVGFNWDASQGEHTTQFRGGVGIFQGPVPYVWISNQASNTGVQFGSYTLTAGSGGVLPTDPRFIFNPNVDANRPAPGTATANSSYNLAVSDPNFKFPKVFRANLALDKKLPWDITGTFEAILNQDINSVYFENVNLPTTGANLSGADTRFRYSSSQIYGSIPAAQGGNNAARPNISDAIVMKNSNKGYSYNLSAQFQKTMRDFYFSLSYAYGRARNMNDGGSIAQSMWRDRVVSGDPNANVTSYAAFNQPHRVFFAASYRKEYAQHFATSLGLTFEAANAGTFSYTYATANGITDLNNDGLTSNDLIYIPRNSSEITLIPTGVSGDTRTAAQQWEQLDAYISQDKYLSKRRGQYAERNGALVPFFKTMNLNFTQDFFIMAGGKRQTLQFTADILNFGNFLNKNWGNVKFVNRSNGLLTYRGLVNNQPTFSFPYQNATTQTPLTSTFSDGTSLSQGAVNGSTGNQVLGSRWLAQFGIRYKFN